MFKVVASQHFALSTLVLMTAHMFSGTVRIFNTLDDLNLWIVIRKTSSKSLLNLNFQVSLDQILPRKFPRQMSLTTFLPAKVIGFQFTYKDLPISKEINSWLINDATSYGKMEKPAKFGYTYSQFCFRNCWWDLDRWVLI